MSPAYGRDRGAPGGRRASGACTQDLGLCEGTSGGADDQEGDLRGLRFRPAGGSPLTCCTRLSTIGRLGRPMSASKRHHYVPKFLLRQFSLTPDAKNPVIWKLDRKTGRPTRTAVDGEAVVGHFYRLQEEPGEASAVEKDLAMIEGIAADHIERLLEGRVLSPVDRTEAATFFLLQQRRTPRVRQWTVELMEREAELLAGINITKGEDKIREFLLKEHGAVTDDEVATFQQDLLTAWQEGRIVAEATSEHEVLAMFVAGNEVAEAIASQMTWHVLHSDSPHEFVIADHPVCVYDPLAPEGMGAGWLSSHAVEVTLPVDRHACLMFRPGPPVVRDERAVPAKIADLNLRSYASGEWAIYGSSQLVVQGVRAQARRNRQLVTRYLPRKPHMFVFERMEGAQTPHSVKTYEPRGRPVRGFIRPRT
jgi:hypothetical protein